jgi:SAM-dependent MidA family methyltransferase
MQIRYLSVPHRIKEPSSKIHLWCKNMKKICICNECPDNTPCEIIVTNNAGLREMMPFLRDHRCISTPKYFWTYKIFANWRVIKHEKNE